MDYKFGPKNNWRRTVWNQISVRLAVPARDALVLYLAGKDDLDREIARRHGFRDENLLAIETSPEVVSALRSKGVNCINGSLHELITSWSATRPVDVVIADFCNGFTSSNLDAIVFSCIWPAFHRAVIACNLLRGRDSETNPLRAHLEELLEREAVGTISRHRGKMLYAAVRLFLNQEFVDRLEAHGQMTAFDATKARHMLHRVMAPHYYSYRSTKSQTFDSVVFTNPFRLAWDRSGSMGDAETLRKIDKGAVGVSDPAARRRIAASMAHRTMRLK